MKAKNVQKNSWYRKWVEEANEIETVLRPLLEEVEQKHQK
jgi:hypothetical protein